MKGAFSYFDGERATRHNLKPRPPGNNHFWLITKKQNYV